MTDPTYRIQGRNGRLHRAQWNVLRTDVAIGLACHIDPRHDLGDVAESLAVVLSRLLSVQYDVRVRIAGDALGRVSLDTTLSIPYTLGASTGDLLTSVREHAGDGGTVDLWVSKDHAIDDEEDLVAAAGLRLDFQPIEHAGGRQRRGPRNREVVVHPLLPPDAHLILGQDPRFTALLGGHRDLAALADSAQPADWYDVESVIMDVETIMVGLEGLPLEDEATSILTEMLGPKNHRHAEAMGRRYGTDGETLATLDEVAREVGVTRERVRQIQTRIVLPHLPLYAPAADAATRLLDGMLPATIAEIGEAFAAAGISQRALWRAKPLASVLSLTGRKLDLAESEGLIATPDAMRGADRIVPIARALSNQSGSTEVAEVLVRLAKDGHAADRAVATRFLRTAPSVKWFTDDRFWVDHNPGRNRLVNTSMRILAVIEPQTLDDMWGGVDRNFRWRASTGGNRFAGITVPDLDDLAAFYASHPAFEIDDCNQVRAGDPADMDLLGEETIAMVNILANTATGLMTRNDLIEACTAAGMNASTASVFMTYGECFKNYGRNVWGLRGLAPDESVIEDAQRSARDKRRQYDRRTMTGQLLSGRPWLALKITPTILYSGVVTAKWLKGSASRQDLDVIDMTDGEHVGTLRMSGPFNYGYVRFLGKHAARVGDVLRVLADPSDGVCHAELGGDELLSEPFDL